MLLEKIKAGDEATLKSLYEHHRNRFIGWFFKNYSIDKENAIELYQRAFTILFLNFKEEKITTLDSSIETYLFGIGKNLIRANLRIRKSSSLENIPESIMAIHDFKEKQELTHRQEVVRSILKRIKEPCKTILELYYFRNFSMESIARDMGYKSDSVAKKKKCQCLQKIRKDLQELAEQQ